MIEPVDDFGQRRLDVLEVDQYAQIVEPFAAERDVDLVVVAVEVLAGAFVFSEPVCRGELRLDCQLEHAAILYRYSQIIWPRPAAVKWRERPGGEHGKDGHGPPCPYIDHTTFETATHLRQA